jgi:thiol-disulfide isomerase/thioredoxin
VKVQLLVSEWCKPCHEAERIWRSVAEERAFDFQVVDMAQPEGKALAAALRLRSIPALVIDGELKGVGVQGREEALRLVADAPPKASGAIRHVGLGLETSSRIAVLSAVVYLLIAGLALPAQGSLLLDGPGRAAPLHVFTLGFVTFMVYGLGEHMLPRFTENPIRLGPWAWLQLGLAHAGVLALAAGFWWGWALLTVAGGVAAWLALLLFFVRIWPVLWPADGA